MTEPVPLDPPDDPKDLSPPFPDIPPWQVVDQYTATRLTLAFTEAGEVQLTASSGDPKDGPYQVLRLDIQTDDLARLVRDHLVPLLVWEQAERERTADAMAQDEARRRAVADGCAWVVQTAPSPGPGNHQIRLHRSDCPVLKRSGVPRRGEHTHGGTHGGQELLRALDGVERSLRQLVGVDLVRAKLHAASMRSAGRVRDTNPDRRPLTLCLTCKPLGEQTPALATKIKELTETTRVVVDQDAAVTELMARMRELVWEVEQAHLDTLRGMGRT